MPRPASSSYPNQTQPRWRRPSKFAINTSLAVIALVASALFFWKSYVIAKASWTVSKAGLTSSDVAYRLAPQEHRYSIWRDCQDHPKVQNTDTCQMYACLDLDAVLALEVDQGREQDAVFDYLAKGSAQLFEKFTKGYIGWHGANSETYATNSMRWEALEQVAVSEGCKHWIWRHKSILPGKDLFWDNVDSY